MPENYSDTPLLLHLKLREIEIIILYGRNNVSLYTNIIPQHSSKNKILLG